MGKVKHPEVTVQLSNEDGNALAIVARTSRAMKTAGVSEEEIDEYRKEALSGAYDNVLTTTMRWVQAH